MDDTPKKPRRSGRPRTRHPDAKGIRCEFSPEEHAIVTRAAEASQKTLGAFVSEAAVKAARRKLDGKEKS